MKLIKEPRKGFEKWVEKLPIPYDLKKVNEADKKWEELKTINGL